MNVRYLLSLFIIFIFPQFALSEEKIKIGVSVPLTGGGAIYGEDIRDVLQFVHRDLAQERYQLIFEDDKCSPKDSVTAAQNLIRIHKVGYAFGFACSGTVLAADSVYAKAKVPEMVVFASSPRIRDLQNVFRTFPSDEMAGSLLGEAISEKFKAVGVISEETDYTQDLKNALLPVLKKNSVTAVTEDYLPGAQDFKTNLLRFKAQGLNALVVNPQLETTFSLVVKKLKEIDWAPQVYAAYWPASPEVQKDLGPALNGVIFADTPKLDDLLTAEGKAALARFHAQGLKMRSTEAVFISTYEGFRALDEAIRSGKPFEEFLRLRHFNGLLGDWSFDEKGEIQGLSLVLKTYQDGKQVVLRK